MSDISVELWSTEKSYTFPFKYTSLVSVLLNPLDTLSRQNYVKNLTFLLPVFKSKISFPSTNK